MNSKIQPQLLRRMTVRRILELLQQRGPSSRADLTRLSGISAPTVSKAVASLLESGLLEEGEAPQAALGRPGRLLRLARDRAQVVGVVLDPLRVRVITAGLDGTLHPDRRVEFLTPGTYGSLIDHLAEAVTSLSRRRGVATVSVGISVPGLVHRREEKSVFSPNLHLTDNHSPARDLAERLELDCVMFQETHGLCLAERMYHGAGALDDFGVLDVTTGMGLGIVARGRLLEGHSGLAGELGHITVAPQGRLCGCGNHGCLETVATDTALAHLLSKRLGRTLEIDEIVNLSRDGALPAAEELRSVGEYLAIAMAAAINLFNPAALFVHGRLFDAQDGLFETVVELTRRRALAPSLADCRILRARCDKQQGAVAAAIHHLTDSIGPAVS